MQPRNSRVYSLTLSVVCIYMDSKTAYDEVTGEWRKLHNEELSDL